MKNTIGIIKEVEYIIRISNNSDPIVGQTDTKNMDKDIEHEIAWMMIYKRNSKFTSFDDYKKSEDPNINIDIIVTIENSRKIYTINEDVLMYVYNYKFDEYYVESEYEISDWAISSSSSTPSYSSSLSTSSSSSSITSIN